MYWTRTHDLEIYVCWTWLMDFLDGGKSLIAEVQVSSHLFSLVTSPIILHSSSLH